MKISHQIAVLLVVVVAFAAACAGNSELKSAETVVEKYHKLYNEQNYEEIFNTAHEEARRTKSKEALGYVLAKSFEQYGRHQSSERVFSKISPIAGSGDKQIEFAYRSKFEKGERIETFLVVANSQKAELHSIGELTEEELEKLNSK